MIGLIWAQAANGVIGAGGGIPWDLPEDRRHFAEVTRGASVVMGRSTWESLPERYRPLPGRRNVVLTRRAGWSAEGAEVAASLEEALRADGDVWVVGGSGVYAGAMGRADVLEVTELADEVAGDTHAPSVGDPWRAVVREPESGWAHSAASGLRYRFVTYHR